MDDLKDLVEALETLSENHAKLVKTDPGRADYNQGKADAYKVASEAVAAVVWPRQPNLHPEEGTTCLG